MKELNFKSGIEIKRKICADGKIELETTESLSGRIYKEALDTKDQIVREALISLGWTPPKEGK